MKKNIFVELLPPWVETGLQPAFYDTESGTVLQQTARMYAKVNETVSAVDNQNEVIDEYINAFNELHDYVHDYFDNLDLQHEVNVKIDEMADDGSLTAIISAYVDPIFNEFTDGINETVDDINQTVSVQNNKINTIENKVLAATSGTPQGAYPTVAALVAADPSHNYIYVVVADGKWYYYNESTTSWTAGGVYQSSQGVIGYNYTDNLYDLSTISPSKLLGSNDTLSNSADFNTSDYIAVEAGETYTFLSPIRVFMTYNSGKTKVQFYDATEEDNGFYEPPYQFTVPSGVYFIRVSIYSTALEPMIVKGSVSTKDYVPYSKKEEENIDFSNTGYTAINDTVIKYLYPIPSENLIDPELISHTSYIYNEKGYIHSLSTYMTTDYMPVEASTDYYINTRYRKLLFFDEYYSPMVDTFVDNWTESGVIETPAGSAYVRLTFTEGLEDLMMIKSDSAVSFTPYQRQLPANVGLTDKMREEIRGVSILSGKKLVACGDSFTQYTNAQFPSGPYAGKNKTYPYLIGLRNDMVVENLAVSGSTIAVNSGTQTKFSETLYTTIPADADYILIKYGINDSHQNIPIGTINDNTNTTFYGAWNVVMSYIIEHYPLAKVGIIVSNGLDYSSSAPDGSYYAKATKDIAKKYGIPTLNEWDDPNVPLLNRTGRTDVDDDVRTIRNETFRVSPTNTHENWQCQEYESSFVEDFLKRL